MVAVTEIVDDADDGAAVAARLRVEGNTAFGKADYKGEENVGYCT